MYDSLSVNIICMYTPRKVMSVSRSQRSITQYNDLETLQLLLKIITHVCFFNTHIQVLMNLDRTSNYDKYNYKHISTTFSYQWVTIYSLRQFINMENISCTQCFATDNTTLTSDNKQKQIKNRGRYNQLD
jgi:hypothetical protein